MSVVWVHEMSLERSQTRGPNSRQATRIFHVLVSTNDDDPSVAIGADDGSIAIPDIGDSLITTSISDPTTTLQSKVATAHPELDRLFIVKCEYSTTPASDNDPGEDIENPLDRPADVSFEGVEDTLQTFAAVNDEGETSATTKVVNSAGQPFDPPIERTVFDPVIVIERNEADYDLSVHTQYNGAVNSDAWQGNAAGTCLLRVSAAKQFEAGVEYWRVRYEVSIRADGWDARVVDEGYFIDGASGDDVELLKDEDNLPLNSPRLLDGAGGLLASSADPVFLTFQVHKRASFAPLNLPSE